ncbi:MAG: hypothetical protein V4558_15950 [Gemmatimonadota bacterium]
MTSLTKTKAVVRISLASGGFWAVGGACLGLALVVATGRLSVGALPGKVLLIAVCALLAGIVGTLGGALFSVAIAAQARPDKGVVLTTWRALLAGAFGGLALMLLLRLAIRPFITIPIPPSTVIGTLLSSVFYVGCGALTGGVLLGVARRARVTAGEDAQDQIGP